MSTLLILIAAITGNYSDKGQGRKIEYTTISFGQITQWKSGQPFCADSAHWRIYNNKRLIRHALFIP